MSNISPPEPAADNPEAKKLSFSTKLAYGAGDLGPAITANVLVFFLLFFFTNVAGLAAGTASNILLIGKVWDAVNDPIVGVLSDRTSHPWGRLHRCQPALHRPHPRINPRLQRTH
jgi:glycoside/pentoside/hexuronide:cation symporter, GPH family